MKAIKYSGTTQKILWHSVNVVWVLGYYFFVDGIPVWLKVIYGWVIASFPWGILCASEFKNFEDKDERKLFLKGYLSITLSIGPFSSWILKN